MPKRRANGEGNIRKRKDGRWEGRYTAGYDPETGKRIIKNVLGKTQAEVKEKLKTAISESQKLDVSKAGTYTVSSWVRTWYEVYAEPRIRPNTKAYYTNYIENHIIPGIGSVPLEKLTTIQIQRFYNNLQKSGRVQLLLCKQAAKNFHTICKKETALKRVLSNLLSAVSLLRFKAVFSCGFRVPPGSGLYQSCAAGSVCIPAGQKYCSPRPRKSCPADRKTLGLPSRCIGHRW